MAHLPEIIQDLALILLIGALVTILFKRIKQPLVLGYIIAGFLVGPHFKFIPTVVDNANIDTYAEIGVIMLLFSLGLEFSFKKLMSVGGSASITAVIEILFVGLGGYLTGYFLGWNTMDSLFLGGMLASSSTTIIIRTFDELNLKTKQFAKVVFGVLVVEDIIVILLMVLLSTIAVTKQFEGSEIAFTIIKLAFFLVLWFLVGIYLLPSFLKKTKKWMDAETTLILSIGLCFGMVILATKVGFSAELGAFVMGSLIAETTMAEKVEHITEPIKQFFGTIFFVSVGMMIDPTAMVTHAWPIFVVTLLTLFGKFFFSAIGALASGRPLKQSIQIGMSMAQIGEFAFIVATLGLSLGVISDFLFPIAVGVSAITTFTTPYMIKMSDPLYELIIKYLPKKWLDRINSYSADTEKIQTNPKWKTLISEYSKLIIINSIVLIAISLLYKFAIIPILDSNISNEILKNIFILITAFIISAPFLWAILIKQPKILHLVDGNNQFRSSTPAIALNIIRFLLGLFLIGFFIDQITSTKYAIFASIPIFIILLKFFSGRIHKVYSGIENQFITNLNEREQAAYIKNKSSIELITKNNELKTKLLSWNAHIIEFEVKPLATFAGKTLLELIWKEQYGINVIYIKRGEKTLHLPDKNQRILPYDKLGVLGTDEQFVQFKEVLDSLEERNDDLEEIEINEIKLHQITITDNNPFAGFTIRESGIREDLRSVIICIERDNIKILYAVSSDSLTIGDVLWIVGNTNKIKKFLANLEAS